MKGLIFRELLEMIEEKLGSKKLEDVIEESKLPSKGAYTVVGTYDYKEALTIVINVSKKTGLPVDALVKTFGYHLHKMFVKKYSHYYSESNDVFHFLAKLDNHIHVEVLKLYPDAQLPKFTTEMLSPNKMKVVYESKRPFAPLAHGLIESTVDYYGGGIKIEYKDLSNNQGTHCEFTLTRE